jgi:hypothetical protein
MNYETAKKAADIQLEGVSVEFEHHDKTLRTIILRDKAGREVRFTKAAEYSAEIRALIPARPKETKVHVVAGKLLGVADIREEFVERYEADARLGEIKRQTGTYDDDKLGVTVAEETVLRDEIVL